MLPGPVVARLVAVSEQPALAAPEGGAEGAMRDVGASARDPEPSAPRGEGEVRAGRRCLERPVLA